MQKINELVEELKTINEILKIFSFTEFEKDKYQLADCIYKYKRGKLEDEIRKLYATLPASAKSNRLK